MKHCVKDSCQEPLLVGTKKGMCSVCKEDKTLLLLPYGFVVCRSCLKNLARILGLAMDGVSEEELMLRFDEVEAVEEIKIGRDVRYFERKEVAVLQESDSLVLYYFGGDKKGDGEASFCWWKGGVVCCPGVGERIVDYVVGALEF